MAHLKIVRLYLLIFFAIVCYLYLFINKAIPNLVYDACFRERKPTLTEIEKIRQARSLFSMDSYVSEPNFMIDIGKCYNAETNIKYNQIKISERILNEFSVTALAGILGHEFGHLVAYNHGMGINKHIEEHWRIDAIGAKLTSPELVTEGFNSLKLSLDKNLRENNMLSYIFPSIHIKHTRLQEDLNFRINKLKKLPN